jgi:hypothetical protein
LSSLTTFYRVFQWVRMIQIRQTMHGVEHFAARVRYDPNLFSEHHWTLTFF